MKKINFKKNGEIIEARVFKTSGAALRYAEKKGLEVVYYGRYEYIVA